MVRSPGSGRRVATPRWRTVRFVERQAWRRWLEANHSKASEVWLVYYKKESGRRRISYNDAVEEALCFGWIDSTVRSLDSSRFAQRFTPRKRGSPYSQANKERLRRLLRERKVARTVREGLSKSDLESADFAPDILAALMADKEAWRNFLAFSDVYKRIRIAFIEGARSRPREFKKRLRYFLKMTRQNKQFGFGGISAYY